MAGDTRNEMPVIRHIRWRKYNEVKRGRCKIGPKKDKLSNPKRVAQSAFLL